MGNHISHTSNNGTGKVILSDGTVHEYDKPLTVAELMLDYPQQAVVELHSSVKNGRRPCALPADKKLESDKVYIMIPMRRGKPAALSSDQARELLLTANKVLNSKRASFLCGTSGFVPLIARMCVTQGKLEGKGVVDRTVVEKMEEKRKSEVVVSEMIVEDRGEFFSLSRQLSGRNWKPNLDTIKEKTVKVRVPHWLF